MNRKGDLLGEETLRVVIAIAAILLLILLLFNIYATFSNKPKIEKARALAERVEGKIGEAFSSGESREILLEPQGWILLNYGNGEPDTCAGRNCFCICEKDGFFESQLDSCNEDGICRVTDRNLDFSEIEIEGNEIIFESKGGTITLR